MVTSFDLAMWLATTWLEAFAACVFVMQGLSCRFLFLNFYFVLCVLVSLGRYAFFAHSGSASREYASFYYLTDALLALVMFVSIGELCARMLGRKTARWANNLSVAGAILTACVLFALVASSGFPRNRGTHFFSYFGEYLFLTCGVAIVLLWTWKIYKDSVDQVAGRLVSVLCVYFSVHLFLYGAREFYPHVYSPLIHLLPVMIGLWLPLGCGFALVSQE